MRPRMPLPILAPRGEPVRPSRTIPAPESRNPWVGIPFALSGVEGSQERNGWSALLPRRGDRPVAFPGAEGPLTLSQLKVRRAASPPRRGASKGRAGAAQHRQSVAVTRLPPPEGSLSAKGGSFRGPARSEMRLRRESRTCPPTPCLAFLPLLPVNDISAMLLCNMADISIKQGGWAGLHLFRGAEGYPSPKVTRTP